MAEPSASDRLQLQIAQAALKRMTRIAPRISGLRSRPIDGATLHPEMQLLLMIRDLRGTKPWCKLSVQKARAQMDDEARVASGVRVPVGPVRDFAIAGPGGALRVRHYAPLSSAPRPLVVFFHGGGFVLGDLESHDLPCRLLCREADVHVLSVDYRLAPEHPFPAAPEDAFAAYRWARDNAAALGADPAVIAVAGDSAGANLAQVVAIKAREHGVPVPALQVLMYPAVDRSGTYASQDKFAEGFLLTRGDVEWSAEHYLGSQRDHPLSNLLALEDHAGLGACYIVTAGFDPLRDEGEALARVLRDAGNDVTHARIPDMMHGFINVTGLSNAAHEAYRAICLTTRRLLARR